MLEAIRKKTKQDSIHIQEQPDKVVTCWDSKFGGEFYLPDGKMVPVDVNGEEMEFLAQINFSQLPSLPGFPRKGLLQFFLCASEDEREEMDIGEFASQGHFQICYNPMAEPKKDVSAFGQKSSRKLKGMLVGGMAFEKVEEMATLSIGEKGFLTDLGAEAALEALDIEALEEMGYDLSDCADTDRFCTDFGNWGCKVGGHPSIRQGDVRLEEEEYAKYSILLFQYDLTTEEELEADTFSFFIKPEDLAACRFEDVLLCWHNCY